MESSTLVFIVTIAVAFIFMRWLISPIPQTNEFINERATQREARSLAVSDGTTTGSARRRHQRPPSDLMVEVVQAIAPQLTREQIVYDLEKTGLVELTIDNYMQNNSLPFPPGYRAPAAAAPATTPNTKTDPINFKAVNLVEKYHVDVLSPAPEEGEDDDLDTLLLKRKQRMILNAREQLQRKLASQ